MNKSNYYDEISAGYDELHEAEQLKKIAIIKSKIKLSRNSNSLDVGCGTGISTKELGCRVGVDPSRKLIEIAEHKYPKITFLQANAEALPFDDWEFDYVFSITAIQNFNDIEQGLREIMRVGNNYVLTFLKRSEKREKIDMLIRKIFHVKEMIEEDKDLIYFCI